MIGNRRLARFAVLGVLAVLLAGCTGSKVDRSAAVDLHGVVTHADGAPAVNADVGLTRVPDPAEFLTEGIGVVTSFGLACLGRDPLPLCKLVQRRRTGADGSFHIGMSGNDVQGMFGQVTNFDLTALGPTGPGQVLGPAVEAHFVVQRTDLAVPDLRWWEPRRLDVTGDATTVRADWSDLPPVDGQTPGAYTAHFSVRHQDVWQQELRSGEPLDARAIEDADTAFRVSTALDVPGPDTTFGLTYATPSLPFRGSAGAPPSRGKSCTIAGVAGPVPLEPCPLTDGAFDRTATAPACPPPPPAAPSAPPTTVPTPPCRSGTEVTVDLGAADTVGTVFTRGRTEAATLTVETSVDGEHWTANRTVPAAEFGKIDLAGTPTARYLRIRGTDNGRVDGLTEVSVWP